MKQHFMSILKITLFALTLLSITSSYAGPANFDFLDQPSYTLVSLSSTQSSENQKPITWQTQELKEAESSEEYGK